MSATEAPADDGNKCPPIVTAPDTGGRRQANRRLSRHRFWRPCSTVDRSLPAGGAVSLAGSPGKRRGPPPAEVRTNGGAQQTERNATHLLPAASWLSLITTCTIHRRRRPRTRSVHTTLGQAFAETSLVALKEWAASRPRPSLLWAAPFRWLYVHTPTHARTNLPMCMHALARRKGDKKKGRQ